MTSQTEHRRARAGYWGRLRARAQYELTPQQWEEGRRRDGVARVAVLGAAGPAGANVCRSLHEAGHAVIAIDQNEWRLPLLEPWTVERVLLEEITVDAVNGMNADVVMAQPDSLVMWLADHAHKLDAATFLPDSRTVALCQDKFECGLAWRRAGVRQDKVLLVQDLDTLRDAYLHHRGRPFWLRARHGAGAKAAILAHSYDEAAHWLSFWLLREPAIEFVAEDYLPGRDIAWTSVWRDGQLVTSFARERLEYLYPFLSVSRLTGTPTVARVLHDRPVNAAAINAVLAVDDNPHGIMSVDMVEDTCGVPRPTEINAGRFFTTSYMSTAAGLNLAEMAVAFALEEPYVTQHQVDALEDGLVWARHIDMPAAFVTPTMPLRGVERAAEAVSGVYRTRSMAGAR